MKNIDETIKNKIFLKYLLYSVYIVILLALLFFALKLPYLRNFLVSVENHTFDMRQRIISQHRHASKDLAIIMIDEASYEYVWDKYGEWPIKRGVYADLIDYLETQKPAAVSFDLMFVKSLKSSLSDDMKLARNMAKYDNVFTAINFDDQDPALRKPPVLPDYLKAKVENNSDINLKNINLTASNCRAIIQEIIDSTANIGHINLLREEDGIARTVAPFINYKNDFYPHLALKVGLKYLQKKENYSTDTYKINAKGEIVLGKRTIPLNHEGTVILNWYNPEEYKFNGERAAFKYIPFWVVEKTMYGEDSEISAKDKLPKDFFKDKIVYIGTSAVALADLKSVPTERLFPGVGIHTTFINNLIDNNFIKRAPFKIDLLVCLILSLFVGLLVLKNKSTMFSSFVSIITAALYIGFTILLMDKFNIWIGLVLPLIAMALVFTAVYIAKFILKSRDFEYTYALATTDGLTELYNHRYFQEQMIRNVDTASRYNTEFSLILIDIDFFKKFNDNYGHQAGDAVLKQVAQVLKKNVRATDIVCRYGGEEMSIILTNTNNKDAMTTAQKICDAVANKSFKLSNDVEKNVTISLGVATYPQNGTTPQELIKYSDSCLYKAKENGRNQVGLLS